MNQDIKIENFTPAEKELIQKHMKNNNNITWENISKTWKDNNNNLCIRYKIKENEIEEWYHYNTEKNEWW